MQIVELRSRVHANLSIYNVDHWLDVDVVENHMQHIMRVDLADKMALDDVVVVHTGQESVFMKR